MKKAVEILCDEVGVEFKPEFETVENLVMFISLLVDEIDGMMEVKNILSKHTGKELSKDATEHLCEVRKLLDLRDVESIIHQAQIIHNRYIEPLDIHIQMLDSCVSGLRFGLKEPCRSRHAAHAADYVWEKKYGISLFDKFTSKWRKDWTACKLRKVLED